MDIVCKLEERVSKRTGEKYICLFIPDLEKTIFLEPVEIKLLRSLYKDTI